MLQEKNLIIDCIHLHSIFGCLRGFYEMITSSGMHFMTFGTNFRDAVIVAFTNCATSVFAAIIIFAIMGFKVNRNKND